MEDNKLLILFSSFLKGIIMVKNFSFEDTEIFNRKRGRTINLKSDYRESNKYGV